MTILRGYWSSMYILVLIFCMMAPVHTPPLCLQLTPSFGGLVLIFHDSRVLFSVGGC